MWQKYRIAILDMISLLKKKKLNKTKILREFVIVLKGIVLILMDTVMVPWSKLNIPMDFILLEHVLYNK